MTKYLPRILCALLATLPFVGCSPNAVVTTPVSSSSNGGQSSATLLSSSDALSSGAQGSSATISSSSSLVSTTSSASTKTLALDSQWVGGIVGMGSPDTTFYTITTTPGVPIAIQFDDAIDGTGSYTSDVSTQVFNQDGSAIWTDERDEGYLPMQFTPTGSNVQVRVRSYDTTTSSTGTFAIRAFVASTTPFAGITFTALALMANSSGAYTTETLANDTLYYQVAVDSGKSYTVSFADADVASNYTADIEMIAYQPNGNMAWREDDTYSVSGYTVVATGSKLLLSVMPYYYGILNNGTFGIQVYPTP